MEFEAKLVDLDINFADLDPELQTNFRSPKSSRRDFLAMRTTDRCYNPSDGMVGAGHYEEEKFWERGRTRHSQHCRRGQRTAGYAPIPSEKVFFLHWIGCTFAVISCTR